MNRIRSFLLLFALLLSLAVKAREVTDTLYTTLGDRVIITYDLKQDDDKVEVQFKGARKKLSEKHVNRYKNANDIAVVFFDRISAVEGIRFTGETPSAFMIPTGVDYSLSPYGYFILEHQPSPLVFNLKTREPIVLSIPIYLAHYEKKQEYKILASCGNLNIRLNKKTSSISRQNSTGTQQPNSTYLEVDSEQSLSDVEDEALRCANSVLNSLLEQEQLPFETTLEHEIKNLIDLKSKVKDEAITQRINEAIKAYNDKEKELKKIEEQKAQEAQAAIERQNDDIAFAKCLTVADCETYMNMYPNGAHFDEAKAKKADLEAKEQQEKQETKKRNIWMIIGGALLAILLFVGNQVMQSFRNIRTQRSMMEMQQDIAARAKSRAKSKVQGEIRKQTGKVRNQARTKGQQFIRNSFKKNGEKSNGTKTASNNKNTIMKTIGKSKGNDNQISI